ncbi:adenine deaminase [Xylographa trunciseda]|nr:adenine deaminase [Xylographa trunciseda]
MSKRTTDAAQKRYRLLFTVPSENVEACKSAVFAAGAGVWNDGEYVEVSFQSPPAGVSQFRKVDNFRDGERKIGPLEKVDEVKVDIMCIGQEVMFRAVKALNE